MAEKRFYWLKLKDGYFNSPKIKKLRKIAGGDTFTIIYLKMQLLSVSNKGIIEFEGIEPTFEEELALKLDEDLDNVEVTLNFLKLQGLIESNNNEFLLLDACNNIGSESESAERVRQFREREKQKTLQCNKDVTELLQSSISISNSNSISNNKEKVVKHKYGEYNNVLLTDNELDKLKESYNNYNELISYLDEYIEMKGYRAKSHYLAIKKWVVDAVTQKTYKTNTISKKPEQRQYTKEQLNNVYDDVSKIII